MSSLKREADKPVHDDHVMKRRKGEDNDLSDEEGVIEESTSHLEDGELVVNDIINEEGPLDEEILLDDSAEEGELNNTTEREAIVLKVNRDLSEVASSGVSQKEVRYFTASSVICEECGMKGHMSFKCQEQKKNRCFKCGESGHVRSQCPEELNSLLNKKRPGRHRRVGPPREPVISCFVCGGKGHLDCSFGKLSGLLSCANCGRAGHTLHDCDLPQPGSVMSIVRSIDRDIKGKESSITLPADKRLRNVQLQSLFQNHLERKSRSYRPRNRK